MKRTKVQDVIERFLDGGYAIAEVTDWTHSTPCNCSLVLRRAAKRMGYRVGSFVKDRTVYLYKEDEYVR